eukprot:scaffold1482_cov120-Cylindrotheca_fusiformis.AAC.24
MVKVVDKSWLNPREGEIEKRWNTFLSNKKAAASLQKGAKTVASEEQDEAREDPEDTRDLAQRIMMIRSEDGIDPEESIVQRGAVEPEESTANTEESDDESHEEKAEELQQPVVQRTYLEPDEDDALEATTMFPLFESRNWTALASYIKAHPRCAAIPLTCGAKGLSVATKGNLLLHETCRIDPPVAVVEALLKANKNAVNAKGEKGYLPLHYACACASATVVEKLLKAYPEAAKIRNESDLMLPLHIASKWGFSKGVMNVLLASYPEGSKVRDVFAMVPLDYAVKLPPGETRKEAVSALQRTLKTRTMKERSGLIEQSGKTFSQVREDLNTAQVKLERLTAEFDHRERSFALMFGREQEKVRLLEQEREKLANESNEAKEMQKMQAKKLELLQKEHNMFKAVQKANAEKRSLLQKKVSVLENAHGVKKDIIGRLEHEINVKSKQEMERAMSYQKQEFDHALEQERIKNETLQREIEETEKNHHLYSQALLQEHDQEIMKFEEITRKFELLERELRDQIEYEIVMRESVEMELCDKEATFQQEMKEERERVAYLEQHVEHMNELLESEQKRFDELEELLKEAIQGEDEEQERLRESMEERRAQYAQLLKSEQEKVADLENAFEEAQVQLNTELQRIQEYERRETALLRTFDVEQQKLKEIEESKDRIQNELDAERQKVLDLETAKEELYAEMESSMERTKKDHEAEQSQIEAVKKTQKNMHVVIKTLNEKIAQLEKEKSLVRTEGKAVSITQDRDQLKQDLDEARRNVEEVTKAHQMLEKKYEAEILRVKNLEEAASMMIEGRLKVDSVEELSHHPCPSEEEQETAIADIEKQLAHERTRVWNLYSEIAALKTKRDSLAEKVAKLELHVAEKEKALQLEQSKYDALEQEHSKTLELLQSEREVVMAMREEYESNKALLSRGKRNLENLKASGRDADDEALRDIEAEIEASEKAFHLKEIADELKAANDRIKELEASHKQKSQLLEKEQKKLSEVERSVEEQKSASASEANKIQELQKGIHSQEILLDYERGRCQDLEQEVSRITNLLVTEQRKVADLRGENEQINGELCNTKKKADVLEEQHSKNKDLLEKESTKVESLTRARDQLSELLAWERSNGQSAENLNDLLAKLSTLENDLSAATGDLRDKEVKVQGLTEQLAYFDTMKCEIVRLSAESRRRDMMLGAILNEIGGDALACRKRSVQQAKSHVEGMKRLIGLDLAGLDA